MIINIKYANRLFIVYLLYIDYFIPYNNKKNHIKKESFFIRFNFNIIYIYFIFIKIFFINKK